MIDVCLFIRVSTEKQDCDRQLRELTDYCIKHSYRVSKTISSTITGTKTQKDRPDIQELIVSAKAKEFKKVIVTEISRLGRNAKDIRRTIDTLHKYNIPVLFKNLGSIESIDEQGNESFVTNIIIAIYSELAQEERRILSERVKSGMKNAKAKGKQIGRTKGQFESKNDILKRYSKLAKDIENGLSLQKCVKVHSVSKNTVIKVKRLLVK